VQVMSDSWQRERLLDSIRLVAGEAFAGFNKSACQDRHQQGLGLDGMSEPNLSSEMSEEIFNSVFQFPHTSMWCQRYENTILVLTAQFTSMLTTTPNFLCMFFCLLDY
jgi:hypothetical protein